MADVTIPVVGDGPESEPQNRAQMMLVAAFGIAVMLVALALILNTSIYTENIATRGSDIGGGKDAIRYKVATSSSVAGTIEYANYHNNSSEAAVYENVTRGVEAYDEVSSRQQAIDGVVTNVSVKNVDNGTRIYQNRDRNFTNDDLDEDWELAGGVEHTRQFRMNVTRDSLTRSRLGSLLGSPIFNITFDSGASEWTVQIYNDTNLASDDKLNVTVRGPSGTETCTRSVGGRAVVDITAGTINGTECDALQFFDEISGPYDIRYNNTINEGLAGEPPTVNGTYRLIVDQEVGSVNDTDLDQPGVPEATPGVYSTTVHVTYETARLHYETDVRVAPGEPDD